MKYARPPIKEAVLDIRVQPRDDLSVDDLRALAGKEYSEIRDQFLFTGNVKLGASISSQTITPSKEGFQFLAPGKNKLFQAQKSGFTFNKLAPYESWETFSAEARQLWAQYREIAKPKSVARLGLRYINELKLPLPFDDFKKYILTVPEIAPGLPQALSNFLMQVQIPHMDIQCLALLNVALVGEATAEFCPITLDIDVFRQHDVPQQDEDMWAYFELLRKKKNDAFEMSLTEAMKETFN